MLNRIRATRGASSRGLWAGERRKERPQAVSGSVILAFRAQLLMITLRVVAEAVSLHSFRQAHAHLTNTSSICKTTSNQWTPPPIGTRGTQSPCYCRSFVERIPGLQITQSLGVAPPTPMSICRPTSVQRPAFLGSPNEGKCVRTAALVVHFGDCSP